MTTIAYRSGTMAADDQAWHGDTAWYKLRKIHRLSDGSLFGAAGIVSEITRYRDWLENGGRRPGLSSLDGILVRPTGEVFICTHDNPEPIRTRGEYFATGIGAPAALGAMFAGASAKRAILAAAAHVQGTSANVHTARLRRA